MKEIVSIHIDEYKYENNAKIKLEIDGFIILKKEIRDRIILELKEMNK